MCRGSGLWFDIEDVLQILIFPSGELLPVASSSGFHGHHAIAYTKYQSGPETSSNKAGLSHSRAALVTDFGGASID